MAFIIKELSKQNDFKQKRFARNDRGPLTEAEASLLDMQSYRTSFPSENWFLFSTEKNTLLITINWPGEQIGECNVHLRGANDL